MQFSLPELGEGVHEGELVKWRVKSGDAVSHDQPLCEVMTDKATMEIPSPFEGKVTEIHAKEGTVVKVGQVLVSFDGKGGAVAASVASAQPAAHAPAQVSAAVVTASAAGPAMATSGERVLAAPSTRRLAREMGIDLGSLTGSGPHGRVMKEDLTGRASTSTGNSTRSQAPSGVALNAEERIAYKGLRKKISEKMRLSKDKAAHFTYVEECDATQLVKLRARAKAIGEKQGVKVTFLPFVMKAMVSALKSYPILNSHLDEEKGEIVIKHYYNIGLSIQTDDGLTAPVIKNVESKSILELAKEIQNVVDRARNKKLTLEDFQGGTITLTNAGSIGGLFATPVLNFPEVAILGFNKIFRKPVVKVVRGKERVVIRDWTYFSISLDHRIVDGAIGAEFMKVLIKYIEDPALLLL